MEADSRWLRSRRSASREKRQQQERSKTRRYMDSALPSVPRTVALLDIRSSILVHKPSILVRTHHVDVGAGREIVRIARADFEVYRHGRGAVLQVMPVATRLGKRRTVASSQDGLSSVL